MKQLDWQHIDNGYEARVKNYGNYQIKFNDDGSVTLSGRFSAPGVSELPAQTFAAPGEATEYAQAHFDGNKGKAGTRDSVYLDITGETNDVINRNDY